MNESILETITMLEIIFNSHQDSYYEIIYNYAYESWASSHIIVAGGTVSCYD